MPLVLLAVRQVYSSAYGSMNSRSRLFTDPDQIDFYMTTGSGRYARVKPSIPTSLGLQGPSMTIDTACLILLSCGALSLPKFAYRRMYYGARWWIQHHFATLRYKSLTSQSRMMAPDGKCKFGDARADGFVRSEGVAVLALKTIVTGRSRW